MIYIKGPFEVSGEGLSNMGFLSSPNTHGHRNAVL